MRIGSVVAIAALALCVAPFPLARAADEGCTAAACHADPKFEFAHRTSIAQRGKCAACHEPHAPGQKGTLTIT